MASENAEDASISFTLPPEVGDWLDDEASSLDVERDALCRRLLVAYHSVASESGDGSLAVDEPAERHDLDDLRAHVEAQREEFVDLLKDVRSRVVQVKREADAKVPAADHEVLEAEVETLASDLVAIQGAVDDLSDEVEAVEAVEASLDDLEFTVDAGFENFEEVLEFLVDRTDTLDERIDRVARVLVGFRDDLTRSRQRAEADVLKLAANQLGIRSATCEGCGSTVDVALLTTAACPACEEPFSELVARSSLFGSHRLRTGDPPAIEGRTADEDTDADGRFATGGGNGR